MDQPDHEEVVPLVPRFDSSRLLEFIQIPDRDKFLMRVLVYGHDAHSVDRIMRTYKLEPKLSHLKKLILKGRTCCLSVVLDHIKTWSVKECFPEIAIHLVRGELLSNKIKIPSFSLIHSLFNDYSIDVNHCDLRYGTILHVMCFFPSQQKEVCSFVESLLETHQELDIDQTTRKRRRTRDQYFQSTPLQFAIEKGCYDYAIFLIKRGSRTDNLVFDKYSVRNDLMRREKESYLKLMKILITIGSIDAKAIFASIKLSPPQKKELLTVSVKRSLLELSCNVIRKDYPLRSQQISFLDSLEDSILVDPRIRQIMLMHHLD